ncbi:MAG: precorrin-3B C(17)-methyltransferase [Cyanobacteria bacterium P01_F01_bin.150]
MNRDRFKSLAAIATTPQGARLLIPLCQAVNQAHNSNQDRASEHQAREKMVVWVPLSVASTLSESEVMKCYDSSLKDHLAKLWPEKQGFIFCLAMGAVVRLIAPLLQDKQYDPAVVVVDENGQYAISACSGHQGQADNLARWVATQLDAEPVLTGAANGDRRVGIDVLGQPFGWRKGPGDWTGLSAAIARQERVHVIQDAGSQLWQQHLPKEHSYEIHNRSVSNPQPASDLSASPIVWISPVKVEGDTRQKAEDDTRQKAEGRRQKAEEPTPSPSQEGDRTIPTPQPSKIQNLKSKILQVQWYPRVLWLGVGCERHTPRSVIETAIQKTLAQYHLAEEAIAGVATIDLKADEPGLVELCGDRQWPLHCFTAAQLKDVDVPNPSLVVNQVVGTPSVAEAAAILAGSGVSTAHFKDLGSNLTDASDRSASPTLIATKQVHRLSDQPGAVTLAIAQSPVEYLGRTGSLALVGMGPGQLDQMTPAAKGAVINADAVIGYGLYLDLVRPILRPGQIVESLPITQERQRAERAVALASWGLSVAVVSSGDCGIYGMAGLVMEQLQRNGWNGHTPGVRVFPGVTALQAAAARVGAPLMHDFCAISLSDLLTPWEVIERRLEAAARDDFVTALYNPKSKTRVKQMALAHKIFLKYRSPETPVALVRSAYRMDEQIALTTVGKLLDNPIDMMTLVLIGNKSTQRLEEWLITPRGYFPQHAEH